MAQRDKNGETASERIARKFLSGEGVNECNTTTTTEGRKIHLQLYYSRIATFDLKKRTVFIYNNHQFSGSRLSNERKQAIRSYLRDFDKITIKEEV